MCGFAGVLGKSARVGRDTLAVMAASLAHRGPDDEGVEVLPLTGGEDLCLGLVHRRLAIIDLSEAAHQPMTDEQTGNWIVYNGEVYNHQEIRRELEQLGHTFRSSSDTEVILKAYSRWGVECLDRLRGMFALAIWEPRNQRLFLAVDRFGIKPLYIHQAGGLFAFSSELRTLLKSRLVRSQVEPLAVESYLAYGAVQAPLTMVKDVYAMLPGQYMIYSVRDRSARQSTYWRPARPMARASSRPPRLILERMREVLADSVTEHLVSDVPVALFLSGGIDSSAIVALANGRRDGALQSFSANFTDERFSEQKYSDLIAKRYCRHHTRISIREEDLAWIVPGGLEAMDQPTVDGINLYTIARAVRQAGIKVVLSGQGGDEIFGGYLSFSRVPRILAVQSALAHLPHGMRSGMASVLDAVSRQRWAGSKLGHLVRSDPDLLATYLTFRQLFGARGRGLLLRDRRDDGMVDGVPSQVVQELAAGIKGMDSFDSLSVLELRLFLANMLLRDGDFMSMAHGLEVRVPFLDHRVVEYVFALTTSMKSARGVPKPLLVRAMGDLLPKEIWQRPKMGFFFPWDLWLRQKLRPQIEDLLHRTGEDNALGLHVGHCRSVWQRFLARAPGVTWTRAWAIYVLLAWHERHMATN